MEKKQYYNLSDNYDLSNLTLCSMAQVADFINDDMKNLTPEIRDEVVYTIKPIMLTEKEYVDLGEYQF